MFTPEMMESVKKVEATRAQRGHQSTASGCRAETNDGG